MRLGLGPVAQDTEVDCAGVVTITCDCGIETVGTAATDCGGGSRPKDAAVAGDKQ